jgi:hypothetical protein
MALDGKNFIINSATQDDARLDGLARSWNFTEAARDLDSKLCLLAWLRVLSHELQACVWHSGRDAQFS